MSKCPGVHLAATTTNKSDLLNHNIIISQITSKVKRLILFTSLVHISTTRPDSPTLLPRGHVAQSINLPALVHRLLHLGTPPTV
jgi:hypothetical protein